MSIASVVYAFSILTSFINPVPNFRASINSNTTAQIKQSIADGLYDRSLDYNGDGKLTLKDAFYVKRRYQNNLTNGNQITVSNETAMAIIEEKYDTPIDWEFCKVNNQIVRAYEITTNKIIPATIRAEFEDFSVKYIEIEINPFEETVYVKE